MKKKYAVVFVIPGGREIEYKENADKNFDLMFDTMRNVVKERSVKILHNGPLDLKDEHNKFFKTKGFTTYAVCKYWSDEIIDEANTEEFWDWLSSYVSKSNWPELLEKAHTYQVVSMEHYDPESPVIVKLK